jgi:hypothetical protein
MISEVMVYDDLLIYYIHSVLYIKENGEDLSFSKVGKSLNGFQSLESAAYVTAF